MDEQLKQAREILKRVGREADAIEGARQQIDVAVQLITHRLEACFGEIALLRERLAVMERTQMAQAGRSS